MGLFQAGFEVTGVDIVPQRHYPFSFIEGDALTFPLTGFDFIWASPPCQAYTLAQRIQGNKHPDLIALLRTRLQESGIPWAIENVVRAPLINPIMLCGTMFDLKVYRHRLVETSFKIKAPLHPQHMALVTKMGRPPRKGEFMHIVGNFSGVEQAREAMGIDWMVRDELREAIPPAYAKFIGLAALKEIK